MRLAPADGERKTGEAGREPMSFVCECNDPLCSSVVPLTIDEYDAVRAAGGLVFAPGHELHFGDQHDRAGA